MAPKVKQVAKPKSHLECTPKEDALAREVALTTNSLAECYLAAGYSSGVGTARNQATKTLRKPHVAERVDYYKSMAAAKLDIRNERITAEFAAIAFLDPIDVFDIEGGIMRVKDLDKIPAWARRAIMSIKQTESEFGTSIEVKFHPKTAALTKLAEIKNMFKENNKGKAPSVHLDLSFPGAR